MTTPVGTRPTVVPRLDDVLADPARVHGLPRALLAALALQTAAVQATVAAELVRATPSAPGPAVPAESDRLLTPEEAAQILGVDARYLRRHHQRYRFAKKLGHRTLRFSETGLRRWLAAAKGLTR